MHANWTGSRTHEPFSRHWSGTRARTVSSPHLAFIAGSQPSYPPEMRRRCVAQQRNGWDASVTDYTPMYNPAHYVVIFPKGDPSYALINKETKEDTVYKFYQQRLQIRPERLLRTSSSLRLGHSVRVQQRAWGAGMFRTFLSSYISWHSILYFLLYHDISVIGLF